MRVVSVFLHSEAEITKELEQDEAIDYVYDIPYQLHRERVSVHENMSEK